MTEAEIDAEYNAAKDEYEQAEKALARARYRLNQAAHEMCKAFDRRFRVAEPKNWRPRLDAKVL